MSPIAPPALVVGAPRLALPYGLFSTFPLRPDAERWERGVQFEVGTCEPAGGIGEFVCNPGNEQQSIAIGGVGLTSFTLTYAGQTTGAIAAAAAAATVQAELVALSNIGPADLTVTGPGGGPYLVTFTGALAETDVAQLTATPTGGTGTVTAATVAGGVPDTIGLPKDLSTNRGGEGDASPLTIYGHFTCSPVGWSADDAQDQANAHLLSREEARVEQALWTGDLGNEPHLADPTTTTVTGDRLGVLEDFIADTYGSLGVLHMTRGAALALLAAEVLVTVGGRLTTALGTPVAAGAGYPGSGPAGQAPTAGHSWVFASPALFGYRGDVFSSSARPGDLMDRAGNTMLAVAERTYVIGFDPCGVGAALINLEATP